MTKALIVLGPGMGEQNKVEIDGCNLANITKAISVVMDAGSIPEVKLWITAHGCDIDAEGNLTLNTIDIPHKIARKIYDSLKARFEVKP